MPSSFHPSYAQGYARNAAESENPGLWQGIRLGASMSLGPTGLTLRDWSGWGNHGTLTSMDPATDWVMTEKGWALAGWTSTAHVLLPASVGNIIADKGTLIFTWKHDGTKNAGHFWDTRLGNGRGWDVAFDNDLSDELGIGIHTSGLINAKHSNTAGISAGIHSLAVSYDKDAGADNIKLYVDAILEATGTQTGSATMSMSAPKIGNQANDAGPLGAGREILSCLMYNRALALAEIQQLYVEPDALFQPRRRVYAAAVAAAGHPTMRRWGGIPHMTPGPVLAGRSW